MAGTRSIGNSLTLNGVGSEADVLLGNIASIGEVSTEAEEIDVTTLDSPNGAKEYVQGAKDTSDLAIELNNVFDGTVELLNSVFSAGDNRSWTINYVGSDGVTSQATLDLEAFIKGRAYGEHTPDGLNKVTFKLRVTGDPVYAEGSV